MCTECTVNCYLRKKISSISHEHKYYSRLNLAAVNDVNDEAGEATEINTTQEVNRQADILAKESNTRNTLSSSVTASLFAELADEPDED